MAEKSPYHVLGISEEASFEEIQAARERLLTQLTSDEEQQERVEQAYDMILMQRLKLRKEGKIAVPDRIRYAERALESEPDVALPSPSHKITVPEWVSRWLDRPSQTDVVLPGGIFAGLCLWVALIPPENAPTLALSLGLMNSIWFLYRKERKFFRSILMALAGLVGGWTIAIGILGVALGSPEISGLWSVGLTFVVMWLVTAFLR